MIHADSVAVATEDPTYRRRVPTYLHRIRNRVRDTEDEFSKPIPFIEHRSQHICENKGMLKRKFMGKAKIIEKVI